MSHRTSLPFESFPSPPVTPFWELPFPSLSASQPPFFLQASNTLTLFHTSPPGRFGGGGKEKTERIGQRPLRGRCPTSARLTITTPDRFKARLRWDCVAIEKCFLPPWRGLRGTSPRQFPPGSSCTGREIRRCIYKYRRWSLRQRRR